MPGEAAAAAYTSCADFVARERDGADRHEWLAGHVYAMAGGTLAHGALGAAAASELRSIALGCGCVVYGSDAMVRVTATGLASYPDASVVCGPLAVDPDNARAMTNPSVVVEVLAKRTEAYDRGEKFAHYRRLASLGDYVLVSQTEVALEVYSREGDTWVLRTAGPGESVPLSAMAGRLAADRVYAGVALEEPAAEAAS